MATYKISEAELSFDQDDDNLVSSIVQTEGRIRPLEGIFSAQGAEDLKKKMLSSIAHDKRLYSIAIESLKAQIRMHIKRSVIPEIYGKQIIKSLDKLKKDLADAKIQIGEENRDIYSFIDDYLMQDLGNIASYANIARSKNEQIPGDLRLWVRDALDGLDASMQNLQAVLIDKAEDNIKTTIPGYTHMQIGQPTSLAHHLMAYVEMFGRDRSRIKSARDRMNSSPFGSAKMFGSPFYINREMTARILGFDRAASNSIDAVTDRDFVIEFLSLASISIMHLSKMAEELLLWQSPCCNFITFSSHFVTEDPITPAKRDPEILELIRGKVGTLYGALFNVLTVMKGLPTTFVQDLSEVSKPVFESYDVLLNCINMTSAVVADFAVNRKNLKEASQYGHATAHDLFDWLLNNTDIDYRGAMIVARKVVDYATEMHTKLSLLELSELQAIDNRITEDVYSVLIPSRAVISRRSTGGSNPVRVRKAIRAARRIYT